MKLQLCESRHTVLEDIDGYIFPNTIAGEDITRENGKYFPQHVNN